MTELTESTWTLCKAIVSLRATVNGIAPERRRESDGTIGDAAHQREGSASDHNPHPWQGGEWVAAVDITNSPSSLIAQNMDGLWLANSLRIQRDSRVKYVIWDRQIFSSMGMAPWQWTRYTGPDPHTSHVHVSVLLNDETTLHAAPWDLPIFQAFRFRPTLLVSSGVIREEIRYAVKAVQCMLGVVVDGIFGPITERAVRIFQSQTNITVDGIVGPQTWGTLQIVYRQ